MKKLKVIIICMILSLVIGFESAEREVYATTAMSQSVAKAYYDVLNNVINMHGMSEDEGEMNGNGLAYATLKDFNGDKVPELYMIRFNNGTEEYSGAGRFIESIWSYKEGKAYSVSSKQYDIRARMDDRSIYLTDINNETYLVHVPAYSHGQGQEPYCNVSEETIEIYTMKNGKMVEARKLSAKWESTAEDSRERKTFTSKEGKVVKNITEGTFEQVKQKYTAGIAICTGGAGAPSMLVDMSNKNQQLKNIYKEIETQAIGNQTVTDKNLLSKASINQQDELNKFLLNFSATLSDFNIKNYNDHELISVLQLNQRRGLGPNTYNSNRDYITINEWPYDPHYMNKVNEYVHDLFGVYPDINKTQAKGFFNYLKAKDSYYFPLAEGMDPDRDGIETKEIYQLSKDTYCISFNVYTADISSFNGWENDWDKSYRQWSSVAKQNSYLGITGQAVVKQVTKNGKQRLNLLEFDIGKGPIKAEHLAKYKAIYK